MTKVNIFANRIQHNGIRYIGYNWEVLSAMCAKFGLYVVY